MVDGQKIIVDNHRKHRGARRAMVETDRPVIAYHFTDGQQSVTMSGTDRNGQWVEVHISPDVIDRLCNARDQWARETAHRGRPVE